MKKLFKINFHSRLFCKTLLLFAALTGCTKAPKPLKLTAPPTGTLSRGAELVEGLAYCGYCHGKEPVPYSPLEGGRKINDNSNEFFAPNITPSRSGIADYTLNDIVKALRENYSPKIGSFASTAHWGYEWLSDYDAYSIALYLLSRKPVERNVPIQKEGLLHKYTVGILRAPKRVKGFVPRIPAENKVERGRYLVNNVSRCGFCHNRPGSLFFNEGYLGGGKTIETPEGEISVPALITGNSSSIVYWKIGEIVQFLRSGITPSGKQVSYCPVNFFKNASLEELTAIAVYLKSIK